MRWVMITANLSSVLLAIQNNYFLPNSWISRQSGPVYIQGSIGEPGADFVLQLSTTCYTLAHVIHCATT